MIHRHWSALLAGGLLFLALSTHCPADDDCEAWRSHWIRAMQRLEHAAESVRRVKEASFASRIQQELDHRGNAVSVAHCVRAVLKERSEALRQERDICQSRAREENQAFEQWRRCILGGNARQGRIREPGPDAAGADRKRLLGVVQDLLMDEAYVQYKNYQPPASAAYSGGEQQQWGFDRNTVYRPYQGYGGYR